VFVSDSGSASTASAANRRAAAARPPVLAAAVRGELHPVVDDVLPLSTAAEAHRRMDAGAVFGRIVLVP
jgi:NADPH:quinone reductase-like Zn-dependent oxidoreductase